MEMIASIQCVTQEEANLDTSVAKCSLNATEIAIEPSVKFGIIGLFLLFISI